MNFWLLRLYIQFYSVVVSEMNRNLSAIFTVNLSDELYLGTVNRLSQMINEVALYIQVLEMFVLTYCYDVNLDRTLSPPENNDTIDV